MRKEDYDIDRRGSWIVMCRKWTVTGRNSNKLVMNV